jgi:hypothetical protein
VFEHVDATGCYGSVTDGVGSDVDGGEAHAAAKSKAGTAVGRRPGRLSWGRKGHQRTTDRASAHRAERRSRRSV